MNCLKFRWWPGTFSAFSNGVSYVTAENLNSINGQYPEMYFFLVWFQFESKWTDCFCFTKWSSPFSYKRVGVVWRSFFFCLLGITRQNWKLRFSLNISKLENVLYSTQKTYSMLSNYSRYEGRIWFLNVFFFLLHPHLLFTEQNNEIYSIILCRQYSVLSSLKFIHACFYLFSSFLLCLTVGTCLLFPFLPYTTFITDNNKSIC